MKIIKMEEDRTLMIKKGAIVIRFFDALFITDNTEDAEAVYSFLEQRLNNKIKEM